MESTELKAACVACIQEARRVVERAARKAGHSQLRWVSTILLTRDASSVYLRTIWDRPAYMKFADFADFLESMESEIAAAISAKSQGRGLRYRSNANDGYLVEFSNGVKLSIKAEGQNIDFVMVQEDEPFLESVSKGLR